MPMEKTLNYCHEDEVRVSQIEDIEEFLEKNYNQEYFYQEMVEIDYPEKTKLLSTFSIFENIEKVEFKTNDELEEDYVIYFKNGNKKTILKEEIKNGELIICRPLMENKDLINIETIKLLPIELDNYFRTVIKRHLKIKLPELDEISTNKEAYESIKYLVNFIPEKIINMENIPYTKVIKENNQIRYKFLDGKDYSEKEPSIYEGKKIRILDKDIFNIDKYVFLKTYNNNLIMLEKSCESK